MLKEQILNGRFKEVISVFDDKGLNDIEEELYRIAYETESMQVYYFVLYLIAFGETSYKHKIASLLLSQPLCFINGAYFASFYHAKKALELEESKETLEYMLFFNTIPDKPLCDNDAKVIAKKIVEVDNDNKVARHILECSSR